MSTPVDTPVQVKTEIEEPPWSDGDTFFDSVSGLDSNSQSYGDDGDSESDQVGRYLRKRKIKKENFVESSDEDEYNPTRSEEEDDEWWWNKTKGARQPKQTQKRQTSKGKRPSAKKATGKDGGNTKSPGAQAKRRTPMSLEEKRERERERKRLFRLREKEKKELMALTMANSAGEEKVANKTDVKTSNEDESNPTKPEEEDDDECERNKTQNRRQPLQTQKHAKSKGSCDSAKNEGIKDGGNIKSPGSQGNRRPRMSLEEKRERERERKRLFRLREKEKRELMALTVTNLEGEEGKGIKKEVESSDGDTGDLNVKRKTSRITRGERRTKKVSEMTEEEREYKRALWRQQAEKKRQRRREREGKEKQKRGGNRKPNPLTPELQEKRREQRNKWIRNYRNRVKMDPEKWQRFKAKDSQNRKLNRMRKKMVKGEEMTEEEKKQKRMADYFRKQARLAAMTEEERQKRREVLREKNKLKWEKIKQIPGEYEKIQEKRRKWRENLSDEKKERFLEKLRENARKQYEKWRQDPEKWKELKERWRVKRMMRKIELEAGAEKKKFEWSEAMKKKFLERKGRYKGKILTEKENNKRLELRRLQDKRRSLQKKLWIQGLLDEGMSIEQIMLQTETPEHRSHRLSVQRIAKAKRDLRKRLQKFGAPAEEIQQRVTELEHTYRPSKEINRFKQSWKRVDPKELEELDLKIKTETEKFNEFLKLRRETSGETTTGTTTLSTATSKIVVSSSSALDKVDIQKNKNQQSFFQIPTAAAAPPPNVAHIQHPQMAYPPAPVPNPYFSHQEFLHQFSFQQQQPQPPPAHSSTSTHHYPQTTSTSTSNQPHSLQNVLHTMNRKYQEENSTSFPSQPNYQYSSSSSHHGYENSSYGGDDDNDGCYSPPPSESSSPPRGGEDSYYHYQSAMLPPTQNSNNYSIPPPDPPLVEKRPRAKRKSRVPAPTSNNANIPIDPRSNTDSRRKNQSHPRNRRDQVIRDVICDECGKAYNNQYIRAHKKIYHSPHYNPKTKTCLLCNQQFPMSTKWYQHYVCDHLKKDKRLNTIVCDLCGKKFKSMLNYNKHAYYTHGDGLKPENKVRCPVCPDPGRYFKENSSLQGHIARFHPNHSWASGKHKCCRCSEDFRNENVLKQHVRDKHAESYFDCEFCGIMKYTQLSINFHLSSGKCLKMPKGWGKNGEIKRVDDCQWVSLDKALIPCEICGKEITVKSLMKHYNLVHNIVERQDWRCLDCGKMYRRREGMVVHMEEVHGRRVDKDEELMEMVRKLNQEDRSGLRMERKKKGGWGKKAKMESGEWDEEEERRKRERRLVGVRRRRIKVICEEDEENETEDKAN